MKSNTLLVALTALSFAVSGCAGSGSAVSPNTPGSAKGVVMNGASPASGATVSAVYAFGGNFAPGTVVAGATTKTDGSFAIFPLLPGTYSIQVSHVDPTTKAQRWAQVNGIDVAASQEDNVGAIPLN